MNDLSSPITSQQSHILLLLTHNYRLRRNSRTGKWVDTHYCDNHSPAACQWLLDHELLTLERSIHLDATTTVELFTLSALGRTVIAEHTATQNLAPHGV